MKKKLFALLLMLALFCLLSLSAYAETYQGRNDWLVTFNTNAEMVSNFKAEEFYDAQSELQPGDSLEMVIRLHNTYPKKTDWYMINKVLESLETSSANSATSGGGYTYVLTYTHPNGTVDTLFRSDKVGGENVINQRERPERGHREP